MKTLEEDLQTLMDNPDRIFNYYCLYRWEDIRKTLSLMGINHGYTSKLNASDPYQIIVFS